MATQQAESLPNGSHVRSLEKGLIVLDALSLTAAGLSIAETAARTGLDRAGARRLLLTLESLGYVRNNSRKYFLTPRVLSLGYKYLSTFPFWSFAQTVLEELASDLKEPVSISVLDRLDTVYILRASSGKMLSYDPNIGSRFPAQVTSIGYVLLANLPDEELKQFFAEVNLTRFTPNTIVDMKTLKSGIANAKKNGWAVVSRQYHDNLGGIAVPIYDERDFAIAALSVSRMGGEPDLSQELEAMLPKLTIAARRLSNRNV